MITNAVVTDIKTLNDIEGRVAVFTIRFAGKDWNEPRGHLELTLNHDHPDVVPLTQSWVEKRYVTLQLNPVGGDSYEKEKK